MDELTVRSTSRASAQVSDIVLRTTSTTRLVFRPLLVDNVKQPAAATKGSFVFQRKSPKASWEDVPAEPLSGLKLEESYKLSLSSSETLGLFNGLAELYRLYASEGIPFGETIFVRARSALVDLGALSEQELRSFLEANQAVGSPLIARLLAWAAGARGMPELVTLLEELGPEALANLSAAVSVSALKEGLSLWHQHQNDPNEEFWQGVLSSRSYLLEQLFSWPCTVIQEKAYVGGKTVHNTGGNVVDFLVRNRLTSSAALVEIKTPVTRLTAKEYRAGIPNISGELVGSIVQVISYKASLTETYRTLREPPDNYEVFDPPCAVIVGNTKDLGSSQQLRTFELFRRQLGGVEIITFDELFGRVQQLIDLFAARTSASAGDGPDDDISF